MSWLAVAAGAGCALVGFCIGRSWAKDAALDSMRELALAQVEIAKRKLGRDYLLDDEARKGEDVKQLRMTEFELRRLGRPRGAVLVLYDADYNRLLEEVIPDRRARERAEQLLQRNMAASMCEIWRKDKLDIVYAEREPLH